MWNGVLLFQLVATPCTTSQPSCKAVTTSQGCEHLQVAQNTRTSLRLVVARLLVISVWVLTLQLYQRAIQCFTLLLLRQLAINPIFLICKPRNKLNDHEFIVKNSAHEFCTQSAQSSTAQEFLPKLQQNYTIDRFVRDSDANSLNYYSSIKQLQFIKRITDHMMITKLNNVNP